MKAAAVPAPVAEWLAHTRDEADSAYLYRVLARAIRDRALARHCARLAAVEDRHLAMWNRVLRDHGVARQHPAPSAKARLLGWVTRTIGPAPLLALKLREEGAEVTAYMSLARRTGGRASATARTLAREEAEHAADLAGFSGKPAEPWHAAESGGFLRSVIYGFNDGLTANFGLVAGVLGADLGATAVVASGVAGVIADSLSMGSSGYLAAVSEREVYDREIAMEREEIRLMPELEAAELAVMYESRGVPRDRARAMARGLAKHPEKLLAEKVRGELGIADARTTPLREGMITGTATAVGALIPVLPFFLMPVHAAAWASFGLSMLAHFGVGAARSVFTGRGIFRSGIDMFVVGLGVAAVGYGVGKLIEG